MDIKDMVQVLRNSNPASNKDIQEFVTELIGEHRTNQASILRSLHYIIKQYSDNHKGSDLRNKAAVEFASHVSCIDTYIPFI